VGGIVLGGSDGTPDGTPDGEDDGAIVGQYPQLFLQLPIILYTSNLEYPTIPRSSHPFSEDTEKMLHENPYLSLNFGLFRHDVGDEVGLSLGICDGKFEGNASGGVLGKFDGTAVGEELGINGAPLGKTVRDLDGKDVGWTLGDSEGTLVLHISQLRGHLVSSSLTWEDVKPICARLLQNIVLWKEQ